MMNRSLGVAAMALAVSWPTFARAEPGDDATRADALFKDAMDLRSAGRDADACPKFAESRRLVPGVGVTLYLAQCYERTGRPASAWKEFRAAEKLANERNDKRGALAGERAAALEPSLCRLTVAAPASAVGSGAEIQVDGAALPAASWNAALAVDPGDHVVTFASPGQTVRTFSTHVDASNPSAVVRIEEAPAPAAAAATEVATPFAAEAPSSSSSDVTARWGAGGMMLAGAIGIGVGAWLVTDKVQHVMPDGTLCDPHLRQGAITGGAVAFSLGGIAVISGVALYIVHRPGRAQVSLAPMMTPGGAGALLRTTF